MCNVTVWTWSQTESRFKTVTTLWSRPAGILLLINVFIHIVEIIHKYSRLVERLGLDENFVDVTELVNTYPWSEKFNQPPPEFVFSDTTEGKNEFIFSLKFFVGHGSFYGATDCPYFGLRVTPHRIQSQTGSLRVTSGTTPAFSTNRGWTLYKRVYSRPPLNMLYSQPERIEIPRGVTSYISVSMKWLLHA